jgi:NAD(P)-dependent dehydrogenase (short-subunit alcohol dehydrogenase family)
MPRSYVVTGGGSGVGRVIAERLLADGGAVAVLDHHTAALRWASAHPAGPRVIPLAMGGPWTVVQEVTHGCQPGRR